MKTAAILLAALAFALSSCGDSTVNPKESGLAAIYFPLHLGDEWIYYVSPNPTISDSQLFRVNDVEHVSGTSYYETSFRPKNGPIVLIDHPLVYHYEGTKVIVNSWVMYDFANNSVNPSDPFYPYIIRSGETVEVNAGTFTDCITIKLRVDSAEYIEDTFAPNVGLIRRIVNGNTLHPVTAKINGKEYGKK